LIPLEEEFYRAWKTNFLRIWFSNIRMAAAASAACRRVVGYQFGSNSGGIGFGRGGSGAVSPSNLGLISQNRNISQHVNSNGRRLFLVDTLALVSCYLQQTLFLFLIYINGLHLFPC
jgi:hypothetical protein